MKYPRTPIIPILIWLCLWAGVCLPVAAQTSRSEEEDVVYLHNGSMIRGIIIEQVPGESVSIQVAEGRVFTFASHEIEVITREPSFYVGINIRFGKAYRPIIMRDAGYYHRFTLGLGFTQGPWGPQGNAALGYHVGYIFRPRLRAGVSTGFDFYEGGAIWPVRAEVMADLAFKPITPVALARLGYGFGIAPGWRHDVFRGGLTGELGVGLRFRTRSRVTYMLTGGYKFQQTYQEFRDFRPGSFTTGGFWLEPEPVFIQGTRLYQRTYFEFGISF